MPEGLWSFYGLQPPLNRESCYGELDYCRHSHLLRYFAAGGSQSVQFASSSFLLGCYSFIQNFCVFHKSYLLCEQTRFIHSQERS